MRVLKRLKGWNMVGIEMRTGKVESNVITS